MYFREEKVVSKAGTVLPRKTGTSRTTDMHQTQGATIPAQLWGKLEISKLSSEMSINKSWQAFDVVF